MTALRRLSAIVLLASGLLALSPASAKGVLAAANPEAGVHQFGKTDAKIQLTEYVSYTCPHCSHFEQEAGDPLRLLYIRSGKVRLEVRHLVRDPFDLTAAMLANCGPAARFDRNHAMFMGEQATWLGKLIKATQAQKNRYSTGSYTVRRQAIAQDAGFYPMMQRRGYDRAQIDRCLADESMAKALSDKTAGYVRDKGVSGTPSFAIDGILLAGTSNWESLKFQLDLRL
ncbi:DsbA family protein [Croceicoccus bisphenolivorans]|uniref:DsbA family protein n=1 Tax=Croceicoccus bisphenolivorans TaxID=1783232 RepID=UPI00082D19A0|nr:thioredoxin domain-containing protein [Croceicoccus bisphenolivorans]